MNRQFQLGQYRNRWGVFDISTMRSLWVSGGDDFSSWRFTRTIVDRLNDMPLSVQAAVAGRNGIEIHRELTKLAELVVKELIETGRGYGR